MTDYSFIIIFTLAVIAFVLFGLFRDKNPRDRFIGDRSWARQSEFMFVDGVLLVVAMVSIYVLIRLAKWAWIHWTLHK